jgi:cytidylate kinase
VIETITVEREFGSGAGAISKKLAKKLGWALWDEKLTHEIAGRLKCDVRSVEQREERPDSTFYSLMKIFMRGSYEERYSGTSVDVLDAESLSHMFEKLISDVADRGPCVIVGRAAPWFLRERANHMGIFIFAPHHEKLRRLTDDVGKSEDEAERLLESVDQNRAAFVKKYYGKQWPTRDLYHLMINSVVGDEAVIDLILHEMEILNRHTVMTR